MSPASTQRRKRGLNPVPKENVSFTAPLDQAPPAGFVSVTRVIPVWGGGRKWEKKSLFHKFVRRESQVEMAGPDSVPAAGHQGCRHLSLARFGGPKAPP